MRIRLDHTTRGICALLWAATAMAASAATEISLGTPSGGAGEVVDLPIDLATDDDPVALQFDLGYDPAEFTIEEASAGGALDDHGVGYQPIADGLARAMAVSPTSAQLGAGRLVTFRVRLLRAVAPGTSSVSLGNITVSNADGSRVGVDLDGVARIAAPAAGSRFQSGEQVLIRAVSISNENSLTTVEFLVNGETIATRTSAPFETTWIAGVNGTYVLTLVATDDTGKTRTSSPVSIQVGEPGTGVTLEEWLDLYFTPAEQNDPAISGLLVDPENDSLSNLLELGLGGHPRESSPGLAPESGTAAVGGSEYLTLTYRRPVDAPQGVDYLVQASGSMQSWTDQTAQVVEVDRRVEGDQVIITIRDAAAIAPGQTRFLRLVVRISQ